MTTRTATRRPSEREPARKTGVVIHWRETGFGFLCEDGTRRKVYVHASEIRRDGDAFVDLAKGMRVEFTLDIEPQGPAAKDVVILADAPAEEESA